MTRFASGDKVDWTDDRYKEEMIERFGSGPFIIRGVEDFEPDKNGACQHLSIKKEVDGKMCCWADYENAWIENGPIVDPRSGLPMYVAAPPTFSNLWFKKV